MFHTSNRVMVSAETLCGGFIGVGLLREHNINCNEDDIKNMTKGRWKNITKSAVHEATLRALNLECKSQSKTAGAPEYHQLSKQQYFTQLMTALRV